MRVSLVGDILLSKRIPSLGYKGYKEISEIFSNYECNLANLETTVHNYEGYPALFPGGGYSAVVPEGLDDIKNIGINFLSTANNHAMDYSENGLLATMKYLNKRNISYAGIGKNLSDACKASFFETSEGRIALISITSSFHDSYAAGPQNGDMVGRPGVNPLKHKEEYELSESDFATLEKILIKTGINNYHNQAIKEGYLLKSENLTIGPYNFIRGTTGISHSYPNENDLQRTLKTIRDAKHYSDMIIVAVHSHQFADNDKQNTPEFIEIFNHECIKAGANVVVCHGPHCLRGIEVFEQGIIFYGLGNFVFQHEEQNMMPEEFYQKYGKTRETSDGVGEILNIRSKDNTVGLRLDKKVWESCIVGLDYMNGKMKVKLYPIELYLNGPKGLKGLPHLSQNEEILKELDSLSKVYKTKIQIKDGIGLIEI